MSWAPARTLPGFRALHVGRDAALLARGNELWRLDHGSSPRHLTTLPEPSFAHRLMRRGGRLARRALRHGPRCATTIDGGRYLVVAPGGIWRVDPSGAAILDKPLETKRRPMAFERVGGVSGFSDRLVYGDYMTNAGLEAMSVWGRDDRGTWSVLTRFEAGTIHHIHALVADPYRDVVWILTGDSDDGSAMWMARDDFRSRERVGRGQRFRACTVFPLPEGLLYATDSQFEPNSIRLLRPTARGWESEPIATLQGSCLCAIRLGDEFYFSTAVEPGDLTGFRVFDMLDPRRGPGILSNRCTVVGGNLQRGFREVVGHAADPWPKRLFGFSLLQLPVTTPDAARLVLTGAGVRALDETTLVFDLEEGRAL